MLCNVHWCPVDGGVWKVLPFMLKKLQEIHIFFSFQWCEETEYIYLQTELKYFVFLYS